VLCPFLNRKDLEDLQVKKFLRGLRGLCGSTGVCFFGTGN
jgi:hypothetical protein